MCWRDCGTASDLLIRRCRLNRIELLYITPFSRGGGGAFSADDVGAIVDGRGDNCPRGDLTSILVVADLACDVDRGTVCRGSSEIASLIESVIGLLDIALISSIAGARADARIVVCECLVGATIEDINDVVDDEVERSGPEIDSQNRILLDNYFFPADLEAQIKAFVDHYNRQCYHESIQNLTPADVYFGRGQAILKQRERIKLKTVETRRLQYRKHAA